MISREPARGGKVRVTFRLPKGENGKVSVVGDFNEWTPGTTPMRVRDGSRTASVVVPAGRRYAFRYLDEDGTWFDDEDADAYETNGFGGTNGVIDLENASIPG